MKGEGNRAPNPRRRSGPGAFITAAFIGPGTVLMCTQAGAGCGYSLLWVLVFSIAATAVLQEMSGRASLATGMSLARQIGTRFENPALRWLAVGLVIAAIAFGCAAYQSGNLSGGGAGIEIVFPALATRWHAAAGGLGILAAVLLYSSGYVWVERILRALVALMSVSFAASAVLAGPRLLDVLKGLVLPSLAEGSAETALGLIGTTVVPYNLFLYSRVVKERFPAASDLPAMRRDLYIYLAIGGIVSGLITVTAGAILLGKEAAPQLASMPGLLEPLLGRWASLLFGAGLFAAGFSSALTAPLAAAYVVAGIFGASTERGGRLFRATWMAVVGAGMFFSLKPELRPEEVIHVAQVANGFLLPVVVVFLVVAVNSKEMREWRNGPGRNAAAAVIVAVTLAVAAKMVWAGIG